MDLLHTYFLTEVAVISEFFGRFTRKSSKLGDHLCLWTANAKVYHVANETATQHRIEFLHHVFSQLATCTHAHAKCLPLSAPLHLIFMSFTVGVKRNWKHRTATVPNCRELTLVSAAYSERSAWEPQRNSGWVRYRCGYYSRGDSLIPRQKESLARMAWAMLREAEDPFSLLLWPRRYTCTLIAAEIRKGRSKRRGSKELLTI